MTRALLIIAAVLVPFIGLVALGFWALGEPTPPPIRIDTLVPAPVTPPVVQRDRVAPSPAPMERPAVREPAPRPLSESDPTVLRTKPYLIMVDPAIRQCFGDFTERLPGPQRVTVTYSPTAQGTLGDIVLSASSWQDPMLDACIRDAFEEIRFDSGDAGRPRESHTFTFSPADAGH